MEVSPKTVDHQSNLFSILYVEDNPANMRLVVRILSSDSRIRLQTAATPSQGLSTALEDPPDLLLLDINLPEMSGYDLLAEFKKHEETCNIPAIAISANAMQSDIQKGIDVGFQEYISKPIDIFVFKNAIENVMKRSGLI